jgi:serine/threonine protein kinase
MSAAPPPSGSSMAKYTRIKVIGQGSYGRAILVKDAAGKLFVIKEVDLARGSRDEALKEVQFMSVLCQHPYIVELREWFEDRPGKKLYIVMRCARLDIGRPLFCLPLALFHHFSPTDMRHSH